MNEFWITEYIHLHVLINLRVHSYGNYSTSSQQSDGSDKLKLGWMWLMYIGNSLKKAREIVFKMWDKLHSFIF